MADEQLIYCRQVSRAGLVEKSVRLGIRYRHKVCSLQSIILQKPQLRHNINLRVD
jgi:hypothetical protein